MIENNETILKMAETNEGFHIYLIKDEKHQDIRLVHEDVETGSQEVQSCPSTIEEGLKMFSQAVFDYAGDVSI